MARNSASSSIDQTTDRGNNSIIWVETVLSLAPPWRCNEPATVQRYNVNPPPTPWRKDWTQNFELFLLTSNTMQLQPTILFYHIARLFYTRNRGFKKSYVRRYYMYLHTVQFLIIRQTQRSIFFYKFNSYMKL